MEKNYKDHLFALIVVGGGGTRLWPRSRNKTPKQFLKIFHNKTLTQITAYRFNKIIPWQKIYAVTTSKDYKREIKAEIPEFIDENIIVEPVRRNTAPAHGIGALFIYKKDPQAVVLNEASDHLVNPNQAYLRSEEIAAEMAFSGDYLVAVGIRPTYPNVGYGYMKKGNKYGVVRGKTIYKLEKFTEKPELEIAKRYIASGDYFWNGNQYVWRADSFLKALEKHAPAIYQSLQKISSAIELGKLEQVLKEEYEKMPEISVDYAVSEKADNFLLVSADYQWTDIGDWKEVWENLPKDSDGNVIIDGDEPGGRVINIDTSDAIIHTDGKLIAVIDVDNVVIIDTKDALLVCSKSKAQNVKKIVEKLKEEGSKELL